MTVDTQSLIRALRNAYGTQERLSLHEPRFNGREQEYLRKCVESTFVSSVGQFNVDFEARIAQLTGSPYAVVTVNGTAALHLALKLAGVERDDEVLVPALSFVATANAVAYCGAIPHFVDINEATLGLDASLLEKHLTAVAHRKDGRCVNRLTGRVIRAIVPMHTFGFPVDIDPLMKVCRDWNLPVIEDAAESLGSLYRGKHTGVFGLMGTLSFNGNKIVTTGGGGAILTADKALAEKAKHLSTTAKKPHPWEFEHDEIGYNYRMPNLNAALGCAQLEQLDSFLESKRQLAERVADAVSSVAGVTFHREPEYSRSNYWLITLRLDVNSVADRNKTLEDLHSAGILARPAWRLLSELPMYAACPKASLENAVKLERVLLNVPSSAFIGTR